MGEAAISALLALLGEVVGSVAMGNDPGIESVIADVEMSAREVADLATYRWGPKRLLCVEANVGQAQRDIQDPRPPQRAHVLLQEVTDLVPLQ